jgi:hypothetical protein
MSVLSAWAEIQAPAIDPHKNAECCNGATTRHPAPARNWRHEGKTVTLAEPPSDGSDGS